MTLGLDVGEGELNLTVDTTGSDEGRVQGIYTVGGHDDFDVSPRVETV
jgi:hypothetical protein